MILKNLFAGQHGETDMENRLMDVGGGEDRVRCMRVTRKLTLPYVDSQQELSIWLRKLKQGLCNNLKGGMGREMGRSFKKEGIYVYLWLIHVEV